jgi:hypothetical protein
MLTPERRTKLMNYAKNNSGPLLEKAKSLIGALSSSQSAGKRAEFDQANRMGHA